MVSTMAPRGSRGAPPSARRGWRRRGDAPHRRSWECRCGRLAPPWRPDPRARRALRHPGRGCGRPPGRRGSRRRCPDSHRPRPRGRAARSRRGHPGRRVAPGSRWTPRGPRRRPCAIAASPTPVARDRPRRWTAVCAVVHDDAALALDVVPHEAQDERGAHQEGDGVEPAHEVSRGAGSALVTHCSRHGSHCGPRRPSVSRRGSARLTHRAR